MTLKLTHVSLLAVDVPRALQFYRDNFGLEVINDYGGYAELKAGDDLKLSLFDRKEMSEVLPSVHPRLVNGHRLVLEFHVDGLDAFCTTLHGKGVHFVMEPTDKPDWGIRTAYVEDLDGNLISLFESLKQ